MSVASPSKAESSHKAPLSLEAALAELTSIQSILGLTSERRNTLFRMDFMISGTGSMIEHGIHSDELREGHFTLV
jgi:hypothetical protein